MGKAMNKRQTKASGAGLLRNLFSKPLRDRWCRACGRPHIDSDQPIPVKRFCLGNAEIQVFESPIRGRQRYEYKVHCWNRYRDSWCAQTVFSEHDFRHLLSVIGETLRFMNEVNAQCRKH